MPKYVVFTWLMTRGKNASTSAVSYSEYILIDRLVINVEMPPSGEPRVVASLKDTPEEARELALGDWMEQDGLLGMVLDGGVRMSFAEADLHDLARAHSYWGPVSPHLLVLVAQIKATAVALS